MSFKCVWITEVFGENMHKAGRVTEDDLVVAACGCWDFGVLWKCRKVSFTGRNIKLKNITHTQNVFYHIFLFKRLQIEEVELSPLVKLLGIVYTSMKTSNEWANSPLTWSKLLEFTIKIESAESKHFCFDSRHLNFFVDTGMIRILKFQKTLQLFIQIFANRQYQHATKIELIW